jgi:predicted helicase
VARYESAIKDSASLKPLDFDDFLSTDKTKISWSRGLKSNLSRLNRFSFENSRIVKSTYRPFSKQWAYFDRDFNEYVYKLPSFFPNPRTENRIICITGVGARSSFSALIVNTLPNLHVVENGQCFPLKVFRPGADSKKVRSQNKTQNDMFNSAQSHSENLSEYEITDGITDMGLAHFQAAYPSEVITKDDLFYYIYGLLHSEDYKKRYSDNLAKEIPRIPCVKKASDFWAFSKAGRELAELHINYDAVNPYPVNFASGSLFMDSFEDKDFHLVQMKFAKKGKDYDKSTVIYNQKITMTGIPLEAYDYLINDKPALEWVMERQAVTTHKDSGIVNDANLWATETMHDAAYPLKLFQRVITVSLETMKIVKALPRLEIAQAKDE